MTAADLSIAEILHEDGYVQYRYSRYLASDGERWIRHGLFLAYHPNGDLASEGKYEHGLEQGLWRDYYDNGQKAAEGQYCDGREVAGSWVYWNPAGAQEAR
jgi:antitoxin component YwqK of YwqJK toxin-antitoxin module